MGFFDRISLNPLDHIENAFNQTLNPENALDNMWRTATGQQDALGLGGLTTRQTAAATTPTAAASSSSSESGGLELNPEDYTITSDSYTGPPEWLANRLRKIDRGYTMDGWRQYREAVDQLQNSDQHVESARQDLINQFTRDLQEPIQGAVSGAVRNAAGQGTLSSSMTADAIQRVAQEAAQSGTVAQTQANVWAANQLVNLMLQRIQAEQGFMNTLGQWQSMARYSESHSRNPTAILPYLAGSSGGSSGGGDQAGTWPRPGASSGSVSQAQQNYQQQQSAGIGGPNVEVTDPYW
jgi:hypothetical protein